MRPSTRVQRPVPRHLRLNPRSTRPAHLVEDAMARQAEERQLMASRPGVPWHPPRRAQAVLSVVAAEVARHGRCTLVLGHIALAAVRWKMVKTPFGRLSGSSAARPEPGSPARGFEDCRTAAWRRSAAPATWTSGPQATVRTWSLYCPFGPGIDCHRIGRGSRSPVHSTCQQRSSSQTATTGSSGELRARERVCPQGQSKLLDPCSPELS